MKKIYLSIILFVFFLLNCGEKKEDLLIQQINEIKHILSQALFFEADQNSKENYEAGMSNFLKAQEYLFEKTPDNNIELLLTQANTFSLQALKDSLVVRANSILKKLDFFIKESEGIEGMVAQVDQAKTIIPVVQNFKKSLEEKTDSEIDYEEFKNLSTDFLDFLDQSLITMATSNFEKAKGLVEKSQVSIDGIDESTFEENSDLKKNFDSIQEVFNSEKEEFSEAQALLDNSEYEGTITKTKEVFRLDNIVNEQLENLSILALNIVSKQSVEEEFEKVEKKISEPIQETKKSIETKTPKITKKKVWKKYKVRKRVPADCLWRIAGRQYGNPYLWKRIYKANKDKIKNPNLIYPNQILKIPPKKGPIFQRKEARRKPKVGQVG